MHGGAEPCRRSRFVLCLLRGDGMANICEECVHYDYDEEMDAYYCTMDLDEDEMERFLRSANDACPFYRRGDDYRTARRQ